MNQRPLTSPENYFSEEKLLSEDGLLLADALEKNSAVLEHEFEWLSMLANLRENEIINNTPLIPSLEQIVPPIPDGDGPYATLVRKMQLKPAERILLLLALEVHYQPLMTNERMLNAKNKSPLVFHAHGYYQDPNTAQYYPSMKSALFLACGINPTRWRIAEQEIMLRGKLLHEQIITLQDTDHRGRIGNRLTHLIDLAPEYMNYFLHGQRPRPDFGKGFPAKWVTTNLTWDHLVLNQLSLNEISDVMDWVEHGKEVISRSKKQVNRSYPCLFYGPPGTGKSFAAKLIGKQYNRDVFRIDLSMIVSKYIGETEKNLAHLFARAQGKNWILFFDEADSLFGKRTGISDSKDKWANLEMSYLLQQMEEHEGLCILATNLRHNIDPAMTRRFQAMINFPWPKEQERKLIWQKSIPPGFEYDKKISFEKLSKYDMSGAGIANVIKSSCIKSVKRGDFLLSPEDISRFIKIEFAKEGRTV